MAVAADRGRGRGPPVLRDPTAGPTILHPRRVSHLHLARLRHVARRTLALRPLAVGVVHGLAGSGALTALVVLARLPVAPPSFAYMALFSVGSIVGMCVLSGLAGWRWRASPCRARHRRGGFGRAGPDLGLAHRGPLALGGACRSARER